MSQFAIPAGTAVFSTLASVFSARNNNRNLRRTFDLNKTATEIEGRQRRSVLGNQINELLGRLIVTASNRGISGETASALNRTAINRGLTSAAADQLSETSRIGAFAADANSRTINPIVTGIQGGLDGLQGGLRLYDGLAARFPKTFG